MEKRTEKFVKPKNYAQIHRPGEGGQSSSAIWERRWGEDGEKIKSRREKKPNRHNGAEKYFNCIVLSQIAY